MFLARGLPTSVLIDRNGVVAFSWIGPIPEGEPSFIEGLEAAWAGDKQPVDKTPAAFERRLHPC